MPTERELRNARLAKGGAVVDAIAVHGQDDFKRQERQPSTYVAPHRPYCDMHRTYWCPCVMPRLYMPPFARTDERAAAMKEWNDGTDRRSSRRRTQ